MGGGSYSTSARSIRTTTLGTHSKSISENFTQRKLNNGMNPSGIRVREARDSEEHPNSVAIILALDLTASMGYIPQYLVKDGLPNIMGSIIQKGVKDPQLLFTGVGDHECDQSPLQVGQFESGDEPLDKWLTDTYLEGGGGGNAGESYLLAWYFAAKHTSIDCFEKRKQKGFLFTIGDEPTLPDLPKRYLSKIMGPGQYDDYSSVQLLDMARETYNVYHLHVKQGSNGRRQEIMDNWKQLIGENLIIVENQEEISGIISDIVTKNTKVETTETPSQASEPTQEKPSEPDNSNIQEML